MKLPRDLKAEDLIKLLHRYGYQPTRQTGSHIRLTTTFKGTEHHITIPQHDYLKVGTLSNIIDDVAAYLEIEKKDLIQTLFK